mgnify:CR=1 FL=1
MQSVRLAIEHTAETMHPMHAFVCESPAVDREVLLEGIAGGGARTLVFYVEGDAAAYEAVLADQPTVESYDVRVESEGAFFLYVRARNRETDGFLVDAFDQPGVVVVPPVEFRADRTMTLSLVGGGEAVRAVVTAIPDALDVDVLAVGEPPGSFSSSLTDRQREAVATARAVGYYEVPRTGGIEAVAEELDCAVSTASALLRRAESTLVTQALDGRH